MHIHEFADHCTFSDIVIGGALPATEHYREFLKKLHPKQILNSRLVIPLYQVQYGYTTTRHNIRQGEKYFFAMEGEHDDIQLQVEIALQDWIDKENKEKPYRAMSNVTILDVKRVAYATLAL